MKNWFYFFICGMGCYFLFTAIGELIDRSGITIESFVSCLLKIRDSVPVVVPVVFIVFFMYFAFKHIDNFMK